MFIASNYRPVAEESDHGTWRRLVRVFFPYTFRKREQDIVAPTDRLGEPGLRQRLAVPDSPGQRAALAWMVEGAVAHHRAGYRFAERPEEVQEATTAWRREADLILAFTHDRLVIEPGACVMASELLDEFNAWLEANHHRAWSAQTFTSRFGGHGQAATHRIQKCEQRNPTGLSRKPGHVPGHGTPVPRQPVIWTNIRFRTADDDDSTGPFSAGDDDDDDGLETPTREGVREVPEASSSSSSPAIQAADLGLISACVECGRNTVTYPCRECEAPP